MKPYYEGLKEIGVDVDELWRKMLDFRVSIGFVTPCFDCLVKWKPVMKVWKKSELMMRYERNESLLWRFERNRSWCWWDMKENVRFRVTIGLLPLFWSSHKMKAYYEGLKEIGVDVDELWRKMLDFRVSIGLLPLVLIVSENESLLWRFERNQSLC